MGRGNRKLPWSPDEVAIRFQSTATGGTKVQATILRYFLHTTTTAEAVLLDCCTIPPPMLPNTEKKQRILSGREKKQHICEGSYACRKSLMLCARTRTRCTPEVLPT
ncbi:hypothetical protein TWF569_006816 [Orbilia oligospora]|nr:hypothetical protein TWF706_011752 [Orbilia oligospora]KAF3156235.1 hypothetical protein TWF569_006816 [Orbilia oligospora]